MGPRSNVFVLCECLSKMNRTTVTKDGKKEVKGTVLDECNIKYGTHFFSKHKDLLVAALEKKTKYDDQIILELYKYLPASQKLSTIETEHTHVCFACRRLFNDTEIHEVTRNGATRNATGCIGKIRIHSGEKKWEMHEDTGHCTRASRLKALHTFMIYESGSDLLRSRLTEAEKVGLVAPVETRGRKLGTKLPPRPPKVIETIKIVLDSPVSPTLTIVDESAEIKALKEQVKQLQIQLRVCEIANSGYVKYKEKIKAGDDDETAEIAENKIRKERFANAVEEGAIEDDEDTKDMLEDY